MRIKTSISTEAGDKEIVDRLIELIYEEQRGLPRIGQSDVYRMGIMRLAEDYGLIRPAKGKTK